MFLFKRWSSYSLNSYSSIRRRLKDNIFDQIIAGAKNKMQNKWFYNTEIQGSVKLHRSVY